MGGVGKTMREFWSHDLSNLLNRFVHVVTAAVIRSVAIRSAFTCICWVRLKYLKL